MAQVQSATAIAGLPAEEQVIDLRSDTVTRPTPAMREAMITYPLGDDVYGGDPTVRALEARMAERLGKEAGLFLASGTQSNLSALMAHCGRGDEYIAGDSYHVVRYEAGGAAVLGGIVPCPIPTLEGGAIDPEAVRAAVKPDDPHFPRTRLVCLENTVSGRVVPLAAMQAVIAVAREHGLSVHLDGARLMNAAVALGVDPTALTEGVDTPRYAMGVAAGLEILRHDEAGTDEALLRSCWPEDVPADEVARVLAVVADGRARLSDWRPGS